MSTVAERLRELRHRHAAEEAEVAATLCVDCAHSYWEHLGRCWFPRRRTELNLKFCRCKRFRDPVETLDVQETGK